MGHLLNLVLTGNLQILAMDMGFCPKLVKYQEIHLNNQSSS